MRRHIALLACVFLVQFDLVSARAEFIGNAFGGQAEDNTRAAAARAFEGYQNFYAGMSQLEQRSTDKAKTFFAVAVQQFGVSKTEYGKAMPLLKGKAFDLTRLDSPQAQLLFQFLGPSATRQSDQAEILQTYADSFDQTIKLVSDGTKDKLTLVTFRQIQTQISRQILVGTLISRALGW